MTAETQDRLPVVLHKAHCPDICYDRLVIWEITMAEQDERDPDMGEQGQNLGEESQDFGEQIRTVDNDEGSMETGQGQDDQANDDQARPEHESGSDGSLMDKATDFGKDQLKKRL
jgi:hypothetical protein